MHNAKERVRSSDISTLQPLPRGARMGRNHGSGRVVAVSTSVPMQSSRGAAVSGATPTETSSASSLHARSPGLASDFATGSVNLKISINEKKEPAKKVDFIERNKMMLAKKQSEQAQKQTNSLSKGPSSSLSVLSSSSTSKASTLQLNNSLPAKTRANVSSGVPKTPIAKVSIIIPDNQMQMNAVGVRVEDNSAGASPVQQSPLPTVLLSYRHFEEIITVLADTCISRHNVLLPASELANKSSNMELAETGNPSMRERKLSKLFALMNASPFRASNDSLTAILPAKFQFAYELEDELKFHNAKSSNYQLSRSSSTLSRVRGSLRSSEVSSSLIMKKSVLAE